MTNGWGVIPHSLALIDAIQVYMPRDFGVMTG